MTIHWKAVEKYFSVVLFVCHFCHVCNFGEFVTLASERVNIPCETLTHTNFQEENYSLDLRQIHFTSYIHHT